VSTEKFTLSDTLTALLYIKCIDANHFWGQLLNFLGSSQQRKMNKIILYF